jgi:hypothetical protein
MFITARGTLQMSKETKERRPPLDTPAAADYLNVLPSYLERLRCTGDGPVFVKRSGLIRYDPDDLDTWLNAGKRQSTSRVLQQYALVVDGAVAFKTDRFGNGPYPVITNSKPDTNDARTWLPVVTRDSDPFDAAKHWRLAPTYQVEADRVVRVYPVVEKSWEHA